MMQITYPVPWRPLPDRAEPSCMSLSQKMSLSAARRSRGRRCDCTNKRRQQQHWQRAPPACKKKTVQETRLQRCCTHLHLREAHSNYRRRQMIFVTSLHHEAFAGDGMLHTRNRGLHKSAFDLSVQASQCNHLHYWIRFVQICHQNTRCD